MNSFCHLKDHGNNKYVFKFIPQLKAIISMGTWVARFYGNEGSTQIIHTNSTSVLVNVKGGGGLSASGKTITDLRYEWDADDFAWDKDR